MTYLLKSEVDLQEERGRYESLNAKFETLNNLLSDDNIDILDNLLDLRNFHELLNQSSFYSMASASMHNNVYIELSTWGLGAEIYLLML